MPADKAVTCWNPPSPAEPIEQWKRTGEACPGCGQELVTRGRGTRRLCVTCRQMVTPPGVAAPWQRGGGQQARQVETRGERDAAARALAVRRGVLARQLRALIARDLYDESRDLAQWYLAEIEAASTMGRLDELIQDLSGEHIRARRWWHADPPELQAITPAAEDDGQADDDEVYEGELVDDEAEPESYSPAVTAAAAGPVELLPHQWPTGWSMIAPGHDRRCQVVDAYAGACTVASTRDVPLARICERHYAALAAFAAAS